MKKTLAALLSALIFLPMVVFADDYTKLWKQVDEAAGKDLPKTQIELLGQIARKAETARSYGNLLKAELEMARLKVQISPDSTETELSALEAKAARYDAADPALAAVYNAVLGSIYKNSRTLNGGDDDKAQAFFKKAMANPGMLASKNALTYQPFVQRGADSKIFNDDLLSLIGYQCEDYKTMNAYYDGAGNRAAALLTAIEKVKQENAENGWRGVKKLKGSRYAAALDSLINKYSDLQECCDAATLRARYMEECSDVTVKELHDYVTEAISKWGSMPRAAELKNMLTGITNPRFTAKLVQSVIAPNAEACLKLNVTNLKQITVKVSRVNVDGDYNGTPETNSIYKELKKKIMPGVAMSVIRTYTGRAAYDMVEDSVLIGNLPTGVYLMEISSDNKTIYTRRTLLHVTGMYIVHQQLPGDSVRMAAVDAVTGQPVAGASIAVKDSEGKETVYTCGTDGEILFCQPRFSVSAARAFTSSDKAMPWASAYNSFNFYENKSANYAVNLFTDRTLYRPGQTVHASAIMHHRNVLDTKAVQGEQIKMVLYDANNKAVSEKTVSTDAYGTAAADFALPSTGLTGMFSVCAEGKVSGMTWFRVEEYKRPTFTVEMPEVTQKYAHGDTLTIRATAKSYAGVPVQGAAVKYKVTRRRALWWGFVLAGNTGADTDNVLYEGEATTSADGGFDIKMPMLLPDLGGSTGAVADADLLRIARFYNITAEADVTDQGGETRSGSITLPLGSKATSLALEMPERIVKDSLKTIKFIYKNAAGKDLSADVTYRFDGSQQTFTAKANQPAEISGSALAMLKSGKHTLTATCGTDTLRHSFVLFSMNDKSPCVPTPDWFYISSSQFNADGTPVYLQFGSSDTNVHVLYTLISGNKVLKKGTVELSNEVKTRRFTYKDVYGSGLLVNLAWVKNGVLYTHNERIERPLPDKSLKLKWTTFRDRLTPGDKEEWTLSVTKPDGTPADAQLMATLYDASLDQIVPFNWALNLNLWQNMPYSAWRGGTFRAVSFAGSADVERLAVSTLTLNRMMFYPDMFSVLENPNVRLGNVLMRKNSSVMAQSEMAYDLAAPQSKIYIRGAAGKTDASLEATKSERGSGDAGADAKDGKSASSGSKQADSQTQVRENLNETAFFYPALQSDGNGSVSIRFTLPESITTWRFMGLAHDRDMNNGLIYGEAVAKKTVMIQPNMPRFVRAGDHTNITAKIFNTSDNKVKGNAVMTLTDPETNKEVLRVKKEFGVDAAGTGTVSFGYYPSGEYSLLICKVVAEGKGFSDGEQHYLPVLSDKEMVIKTVPFTQNAPGVKNIDLGSLFTDNATGKKLTVEYTNNPAWLMIQALPYVGEVRSNNIISLSTAFYANSLSAWIVDNTPQMSAVLEQWKREAAGKDNSLMSSLERNSELKELLLDETPWLADARNEAEQKRSLANYFDKASLQNRMNMILDEMKKLQRTDGAWSWWQGMPSSPHLTATVAEQLVRLNKMTSSQSSTKTMLDAAMKYLGKKAVEEVEEMKKAEREKKTYYVNDNFALKYLYITALDGRRLTSAEESAAQFLLSYIKKQNAGSSLYTKALVAVVLAQRGETQLASEYIKSLEEYSVATEEMGRYYDSPRAGYSWTDYRIPTEVAAIEAMTLVDAQKYASVIDEMKRWLLQEKRTQVWDTPINSANAVYAFLNGNSTALENKAGVEIAVNGKFAEMPSVTAGLGYTKTMIDAEKARDITVTKTSDGTSWGAVYAMSLQKSSEVEASAAGFIVTREILSADGKPLNELKVGDKVTVRITVKADRDYDFVTLNDKRAACMEPASQLSGYRRGYYCVPKDYTTSYFFDSMRKGTHVIETEYYIDRAGRYETGTCSVQCAYAPEYTARAASRTIEVK